MIKQLREKNKSKREEVAGKTNLRGGDADDYDDKSADRQAIEDVGAADRSGVMGAFFSAKSKAKSGKAAKSTRSGAENSAALALGDNDEIELGGGRGGKSGSKKTRKASKNKSRAGTTTGDDDDYED